MKKTIQIILIAVFSIFSAGVFAQNNCIINLAPGHNGFEAPLNATDWQLWDGGNSSASMFVETANPHSGAQYVRVAVDATNAATDFHHRGVPFVINENDQYTLHVWMRSNTMDSVKVFTRAIRDTDWASQSQVTFFITDTVWTEFTHTFVGFETWFNTFLEFKIEGYQAQGNYEVFFDDVELCFDSTITTNVQSLYQTGFDAKLRPNIATEGSTFLDITGMPANSEIAIDIINISGQLVHAQNTMGSASAYIPLNVSVLPSGLYLVRVKIGEEVKVLKLVR